jgi:hypothetical protein
MPDWTNRLAHLAHRFRAEGFEVREDARFFASEGIMVFRPPAESLERADDGIVVLEALVFVYPARGGWELRVTRHGGPHWGRDAASDEDAEARVRSFLADPTLPPGPGWRQVD